MRVRLKYALPLVQMTIAVALLVWSQFWFNAAMRTQDMPGPAPASEVLMAINAPVALTASLWFRYLPASWDGVILIAAIGLFWYWVALNIRSWQWRREVFIFSWAPLRLVADFILIGVGGLLGFSCAHEILHGYLPFTRLGWLRFVPCMGLLLAWSLVLIFFFGRDSIHCILRKRPGGSIAQD